MFYVLSYLLYLFRSSQQQKNRSRDEYDEATAYDSYMNPEPGFRAGAHLTTSRLHKNYIIFLCSQ